MSGSEYVLLVGDCLEQMRRLKDGSVHCCITSPPYFGLRDYGHDGQIGLEHTPQEFCTSLVEVFKEVRRVLRDDGTLWLNLGDSYAAQRGGTHQPAETLAGGKNGKTIDNERTNRGRHDGYNPTRFASRLGLKHKDLIGIPWRVAFALQADGWYLRQDIIWAKPNPMPESVRDRCTKSHEYLFLFSKKPKYYFDSDAIKEPTTTAKNNKSGNKERKQRPNADTLGKGAQAGSTPWENTTGLKNKRSVWTVNTKSFKGAHFATFPPELITPCVLAGCPERGVVLDPFGGSGTTAGVALKNKRKAVLCELNPEYAALTPKRIDEIRSA